MNSGEKKRSLTSEIADLTMKKNGFEDRRLQRKLQELDEFSAKQQKKRKDKQLEFAMDNLSLEDMDTFNNLTRKILRSNFLPPIDRKATEVRSSVDTRRNGHDLLLERLRGSKMIHRYLEGKGPRKLTRSLSADSEMRSRSGKPQRATEQRQNASGPYSAFIKIRPKRRSLPTGAQTQAKTHGLDNPLIAGKFSAERKTIARRVKSDEGTFSSRLKPPKETMRGPVQDKHNVQHHSIGEAIEYKLKMRELSRKS